MAENIRNFVIIAHVDHGKSTLADRFLELTGTIEERRMKPQYLDQLELERERGITIKMAPVRMVYRPAEIRNLKSEILNKFSAKGGSASGGKIPNSKNNGLEFRVSNFEFANSKQEFVLNLIDTPGHSDFSYEVSRALTAVEGGILLVDATQGIQAQTLANFEAAKKAGLTLIGAVNKIDVAAPEQVAEATKEISELLGVPESEIFLTSGKTGVGVQKLLRAVVLKVPPPKAVSASTPQALIFDSVYDDHKGVVAYVRVFSGTFKKGAFKEIGYFAPELKPASELDAGEIGYIATGIKDPGKVKIGGTIGEPPLTGYVEPMPVVFVSFYPENAGAYEELRQAIARLRLNDAALSFEPDMSEVLGRGFKGGFLGRLHFEITAERLAREFRIPTVHSFPSVAYEVKMRGNGWIPVTNPRDFPDDPAEVLEPMTKVEILVPPRYLANILNLKELFRFSEISVVASGGKTRISAKLPLADLVSDLDDKLKSVSEGFASLSYEQIGFERGEVEKLEILVAGHVVPGLTRIVHKGRLEREARITVQKLKELLPQEQFSQAIQARTQGRIIARETIPALRKDVTGYLYGGDRTRKMKLWKKQQKGKKKLKEMAERGPVKIPAHIFKELLKR